MKQDIGLLILRVMPSLFMLILHGQGKLLNFKAYSMKFPDPFGIGATATLAFAVFAEVFCSIFLILGFKTKWFSIPLIITMLGAIFIVHGQDPIAKKELAIMYLIPFCALFFTGGGSISVDKFIGNK